MTAPAWLEDIIARATSGDTPDDPRATARRVLPAWRRAVGGSTQLRRRLRWSGYRRLAPRLSAPVTGDPAVDWANGLRRLVAALASRPATTAATLEQLLEPLAGAAGAEVRALLRTSGVELDRLLGEAARVELGRAVVRRVAEPLRPAWAAWCDEHPLTRLAGEEPALAALQEELAGSALRPIFERFPVAARLAGTVYGLEIAAQAELLQHLARDLPGLQARWPLRLTAEAPPVRDLRLHLGDSHRGGRAVACVEFADGTRIAAKPRSVALEQALETWWCEHDPERPALRYLDRGDHGWMEWIEAAPPADAAASIRRHRRLGALLARALEFGLCDLHRRNVLFAGEHAFVVDGECLRPAVPLGEAVAAAPDDPVAHVLETGILPRWQRRPASGRLETGSLLDAGLGEAETAAVLAGFLDATPAPHPPERLAALAAARARFLLRPTASYSLLQRRLLQPDALADIRRFDALADTLARGWTDESTAPRNWPLIEAERRALFRLDVPAFDYEPGATSIRACDGTRLDAAFASAPADHWPAREVRRMREERERLRDRHAALLRRVLAVPAPLYLNDADNAVTTIARHLMATALPGADGAPAWLGYDCDPADLIVRPGLADEGVYQGRAGIALFLLAAAERCPEAEVVAGRVFEALATARPGEANGWAQGLAGRAMALQAAGIFAGRPDWIRAAAKATGELARRPAVLAEEAASDWAQFDLFSGAAGIALALAEDSATLGLADTLVTALRRWLERDPPRRVGLMHGPAGLALAAGRVAIAAARAGRSEDTAAAWRTAMLAVEWENRSTVAPGFWTSSQDGFDGSWCRHTAGIALARHTLLRCAGKLGAVAANDRPLLEADLARARSHLFRTPPTELGLLCCGQLGRLAGLLLTDGPGEVEARQRLATWKAHVSRHGWNLDATPAHAWLPPSLGRGLAGAGWVLLAAEDARARELLRTIVGFAPLAAR